MWEPTKPFAPVTTIVEPFGMARSREGSSWVVFEMATQGGEVV